MGVAAAVAVGCNGVGELTISAGGGTTTSTATGAGGGAGGATGLPCDVAQALTVCVACHGHPTAGGAVGSLVTYADLTSPAPADTVHPPDPGKTMAEMAVVRLQDAASPMPPGASPSMNAATIQTLQSWIAAGTPMGSCGTDAGAPDPTFQGSPNCTGGTVVSKSCDGSSDMDPGMPCITCHANPSQFGCGDEGPGFLIGGTVFHTGRALDLCESSTPFPSAPNAPVVVITDANNAVHSYSVSPNGNFSSRHDFVPIAMPYTAKVTYMGKERAMLTPQSTGDCNSCHTATGTNNAPGRIAIPQ